MRSLLQRIPVSWYIFLSLVCSLGLITVGVPRVKRWLNVRDRQRRAAWEKRFEKTLSEVVEVEPAGTVKKKRKQVGDTSASVASTPTPASKTPASPRKPALPLPPSTPTPASLKKSSKSLQTGPSSPIQRITPPTIALADTADFETVKPKHKLKSARRASSAANQPANKAASVLKVPERSTDSSASSCTGDDERERERERQVERERERRHSAETDHTIAQLRVEIGVAKAEEGKARNEAEKALEGEKRYRDQVEELVKEQENRDRDAARREAELQSRLQLLSNQYQTLFQRHAALEAAFHDLAKQTHPNGTSIPPPSPHLGQGSIPIYPIAIPMPSPGLMRHPSGQHYAYPSPVSYSPSLHNNGQPFLHAPPHYRRPSGVSFAGPLTPGLSSPYTLSPIPPPLTNGDHEMKKNVEWSVLKRVPDRPRSESDSANGSTSNSSEVDMPGAPIHGLGMGDLGGMQQGPQVSSRPQTPVALETDGEQSRTPSGPPEAQTSPRDHDDLSPEVESELFPPLFPCVSHTREQLAELALLQKSAAEQERGRRTQNQQKRKDPLPNLGGEGLPLTPSPNASPSFKHAGPVDPLADGGDDN